MVAGANAHDATLLDETLEAIVVERPQLTEDDPQHLCLDKGYDNPSGRRAVARHGYRPHIRRIGEEKLDGSGRKRYPARRWVVERTLAWLPSAVLFWYATTKRRRTTSDCYSLRRTPVVPSPVATCHFEIVS